MSESPTPGQLAYVAYVLALRPQAVLPLDAMWGGLRPEEHLAWEAAAQAVLEAQSIAELTTRLVAALDAP